MIEMELPAYFDIDYDTANEFYNGYNAVTPRLKYGNFPMNFVVGAHVIGAGSKADTATALGQIIGAAKAANPAYSNFNTLSNYINGVKSATITASVSGSTTTVQVVNSQPITDFTMKVAIGNVTSATCDGVAIPSSQIKQDALTSSWYVIQTINAGTHVFVINGGTPVKPPVANFSANLTSGNAPLTVQFTDTSTGSPTSWSWDFNGDGVADSNVQSPLYTYTAPGTYTASLTVSNGNGASSKSMTINVNQTTPGPGGSNANLTNLIINSGTFTPAFSPGTTNYTYNMSIVVTPTAEDSNANITVNGTSVASGQALPISLNIGQNTVIIAVTAQNGATKTYTITVNR
jgi:PKD repeat protein